MLAAGDADLVGMARAHIADPFLLAEARARRLHELRPCIACNQGCIAMVELHQPITCLMNPTAGREAEWGEGTLTSERVLACSWSAAARRGWRRRAWPPCAGTR